MLKVYDYFLKYTYDSNASINLLVYKKEGIFLGDDSVSIGIALVHAKKFPSVQYGHRFKKYTIDYT